MNTLLGSCYAAASSNRSSRSRASPVSVVVRRTAVQVVQPLRSQMEGAFKSFKPFNRYAPFKSLSG